MLARRTHLTSLFLGLGSLGLLAFTATTGGCKGETETAVAATASPDKAGQPTAAKADEHAGHHGKEPGPASAPSGNKTELGKGETVAARGDVDEDGVVRRGTKLPASGDPITVADCMAKSAELDGKPVLLSGKVSKVCQKKGCWWSIQDAEDRGQKVRIVHKDYGFFVPSDAVGKKAVAYGVLEVKKMSPEEAEHMAADEGRKLDDKQKAELKTKPQIELRLIASALEMRGS